MLTEITIYAVRLTLPLLACRVNLVKDISEKILDYKLIEMYCKVLDEASKCEICEVLSVEDLDREKFSICVLKFWYRLADPELVFKDLSVIEKFLSLGKKELEDIYIKVLDFLVRTIRESVREYAEDIIYALSILVDQDMWIIDRFRIFGRDFVSKLVEKACRDSLKFTDTVTRLTFTIMSILTALFNSDRISFKRENLGKLARWCREFAEDLDDSMKILDAQLMSDVDPKERLELRLTEAERFLEEAKRFIEARDPVQASEKLYKVAEECIKALEEKYRILETLSEEDIAKYIREEFPFYLQDRILNRILSDLRMYRRTGRWTSTLYETAATMLARKLNEPLIQHAWEIAWYLHVRGFHEMKIGISKVREALPVIEQLLTKTRELLK